MASETSGTEYPAEGGGLVFNPMEQFTVEALFGGDIYWYTPTNATLWMGITVLAIVLVLVVGTRRRAIIPGRAQSIAELAYGLVHSMVEDVTGRDGLKYFPYVMTMFTFVLFSNLLGLTPTSFSTTSQIAVTGMLAMLVFVSVTLLGFYRNGFKFLGLFWVSSAPLALRPVLAAVELLSYFARPLSHSIRLAGVLLAGHTVVKVFATFAGIAFIAPLAVVGVVAMLALELLVVSIQAYVFTILTCVYLKDALHPSH